VEGWALSASSSISLTTRQRVPRKIEYIGPQLQDVMVLLKVELSVCLIEEHVRNWNGERIVSLPLLISALAASK
jgi:hypothetical protein